MTGKPPRLRASRNPLAALEIKIPKAFLIASALGMGGRKEGRMGGWMQGIMLNHLYRLFLNKEQLECFKIMCFVFSSRCQTLALKETVLRTGRRMHVVSFRFPFFSSKAEKKKFEREGAKVFLFKKTPVSN